MFKTENFENPDFDNLTGVLKVTNLDYLDNIFWFRYARIEIGLQPMHYQTIFSQTKPSKVNFLVFSTHFMSKTPKTRRV